MLRGPEDAFVTFSSNARRKLWGRDNVIRREGAGDSNLVKPSMEGRTGTWTPTVGIPLTSLINRN